MSEPTTKSHDRQTVKRLMLLRQYLSDMYRSKKQIQQHYRYHDFNPSDRTLMRDIATLRDEYSSQWLERDSREGKWKEFKISKPKHSAAQELAPVMIRRAIRHLKQLDDETVQDAVVMLSEAIPKGRKETTFSDDQLPFITIGEYNGPSVSVDILRSITDSVWRQNTISFTYQGKPRRKKIPLKMLEYLGVLYVITWSISLERYEAYRLDDIADIASFGQLEHHTFDFTDFMRTRFGLWDGEPSTVIVDIINPKTARNFRERLWHPSQKIAELADGNIRITMECGLSLELISWILHWTPNIKVVHPPELQEHLRKAYLAGLKGLDE